MGNFFSTIEILFLIIIAGNLVGKIKIHGVGLDTAAILLVAISTGACFAFFVGDGNNEYLHELKDDMSFVSSIGTALFVSAIGLLSGYSIAKDFDPRKLIYTYIGIVMVASSFVVAKLIVMIDVNVDKSLVYGALCGALTSTPGLSSACELGNVSSALAAIGYGSTYIFGVVFVIVFTQLVINKDSKLKTDKIENCSKIQNTPSGDFITQVFIASFGGIVIGKIDIFNLNISLGSSGGVLIMSIILGFIIQKYFAKYAMNSVHLSLIRNIGLMLFLAASGFSAGMKLENHIDPKLIFYGMVMSIVAVCCGFLLSKFILKKNAVDTATIISGGMTSTPSIGTIMKKNDNVKMDLYVFTYLGALMSIVLLIRII